MLQISRLAVTLREPDEDAENLRIPMRRRDRIGFFKGVAVERSASFGTICFDNGLLHLDGHVHTRIEAKRCHVIGGRAEDSILNVDQTQPVETLALLTPNQVGRVIITQHEALLAGKETIDQRLPKLQEFGTLAGVWRTATHKRHVPIEQ